MSRVVTGRLIRQALREDVGRGDLTTAAVIPLTNRVRARVRAHASGVVAGASIAKQVFVTVDRRIHCAISHGDGRAVRPGQAILTLEGPARSILTAERVALNFLMHLSGIATLTHQFVAKTHGTRAAILDTRKTLPGLRALEKDAVRAGGGTSHRFGLDDAVLIKTNHLKAKAQGARLKEQVIQEAIAQARQKAKGKFVEVEVTNLREFMVALQARPDAILLDNWSLADIRKAVALRNLAPRTLRPAPALEVSGGVTLENVRAIAKTGVDRISIGRLTHSAPALDVSLEVAKAR